MMSETTDKTATFDRGAAITKSLLGWGVVAGPFYLVFALILAVTRPGFDLGRHALSLLMLGDLGWLQRLNIILTGLMVIAAAIGFARLIAVRPDRSRAHTGASRAAGILLGLYGACLILSGVFAPDPAGGFPAGAEQSASISGLLHLVFGAIGFLCLAAAAVVIGRWFARTGRAAMAVVSYVAAAVIVLGFFGGAALSQGPAGVALLWVAVVAGFAWLLVASLTAYRHAPRPDC